MPDNEASALLGEAVTGPRGLSIRIKVAATLSVLVALSLLLLASFSLWESRQALLQEATRRGLIIGRNLADYSASAVLQKDPLGANQFTQDALNDDAMLYAVLTDEGGTILAIRAASGHPPASIGGTWSAPKGQVLDIDGLPQNVEVVEANDPQSGEAVLAFTFPVIKATVRVGSAYIALSQAKIQELLDATTLKVTILAIAFLLLALGASFWLANVIVRPVQRLTRGALAVGAGNLETQVEVTSQDELGV
ncbi:MAG TPA: HAMP domain-containing protein, partial [bacterium]|nr:HAMP domain-containing protein [bacterium]